MSVEGHFFAYSTFPFNYHSTERAIEKQLFQTHVCLVLARSLNLMVLYGGWLFRKQVTVLHCMKVYRRISKPTQQNDFFGASC